MAKDKFGGRIDGLFARREWGEARRLLEKEREKSPDNHWVLTQLGVTFYEQHRYEEALAWLLASLKIVPDCPLTLWNLAGTLDAVVERVDDHPADFDDPRLDGLFVDARGPDAAGLLDVIRQRRRGARGWGQRTGVCRRGWGMSAAVARRYAKIEKSGSLLGCRRPQGDSRMRRAKIL